MSSFRFYRFLLLGSLISLGACSYALDKANQNITFETPGANGAVCYAYVERLKYKVRPPQTINIFKSGENMVIDCLAPGNRRRKVYIEPAIEDSTFANVTTGIIPGAAWDYTSKAMFKYPDVIQINFEGIPVRPEALPSQNSPDIRQPEDYDLEEFSPGSPRLNRDRHNVPVEIKKRETPGLQDTGFTDTGFVTESEMSAPVMDSGKGELMEVIDNLGTDMDPAGQPNDTISDPIPLFPGE